MSETANQYTSIVTARNNLRQFIQHSNHYDTAELLRRLQARPHLASERAFLLGKVSEGTLMEMAILSNCQSGSHEQALGVLVNELRDIDAAEQYCHLYADHNVDSQHRLFGALAKHLFNALRWDYMISNKCLHKPIQ